MGDSPFGGFEARRSAYSARTAAACRSLAGKVLQLTDARVSRETIGRRPQVRGSRAPIRSGVLDLLTVLHRFIEDTAPLARELVLPTAVEDGDNPLVPLARRLLLIGSVLPALDRIDRERYMAVCAEIWKLWWWTADVIGQHDLPTLTEELCAECGRNTLWLSPENSVLMCATAECLARFPVAEPLPE